MILIARGMLQGLSWLAYNTAMQHIGAARSNILYLTTAFFTVVLQVSVAEVSPGLGLKTPEHLGMAVSGGVIIAVGIVFIQLNTE